MDIFILAGGFAGAGVFATLLYTIGWMIWYERTTGNDPGNAPLAWIFFLGPAGAMIGAIVGLIIWLLAKLFSAKAKE